MDGGLGIHICAGPSGRSSAAITQMALISSRVVKMTTVLETASGMDQSSIPSATRDFTRWAVACAVLTVQAGSMTLVSVARNPLLTTEALDIPQLTVPPAIKCMQNLFTANFASSLKTSVAFPAIPSFTSINSFITWFSGIQQILKAIIDNVKAKIIQACGQPASLGDGGVTFYAGVAIEGTGVVVSTSASIVLAISTNGNIGGYVSLCEGVGVNTPGAAGGFIIGLMTSPDLSQMPGQSVGLGFSVDAGAALGGGISFSKPSVTPVSIDFFIGTGVGVVGGLAVSGQVAFCSASTNMFDGPITLAAPSII